MKKQLIELLSKPYPAIAYSLLILYLCVTPSENLPDDVDDKLAHFLAFGGVGFLYFYLGESKIIWLLLSVLFGVLIEFIQGALPEDFHRGFEILDMVADGIGAMLGALAAFVLDRFYFKA